ncbi:polysaccharide pyruvyl transferase family protein [Bacillus sp. AGMB 02131]|uniref:Polysaccharide pyruvyl transferase family protein n=1 Tax=Peribacillus faecalis TaxID=2772559 RepID=A0A927CVT3_9BACI|nr:polysaccharide pyruvyl transferase family protein [Peribacillus faecalis]MBD3107682.1 polysaccharide pyruvyl transferase family protein [Peribacillus faecalis]
MKVMMFAHNGSLNRGCEAIVRSSSTIIKEKIKTSKVYLVSGKPATDTFLLNLDGIYDGSKTPLRKYSINWFLSAIQLKLMQKESFALGHIEKNIIKHIKDVDIFLSIGGDNYCYGEQPGMYEIDRRIKEQGKKLVLWACSIGEEDLSPKKLEDLKLFDLILARETLTYTLLKDNGLTNVKLCADPAFTMEKTELPLPPIWKEGHVVGLNFSPLIDEKNKDAKSSVRMLIQHILDTTNLTIALTPHVIEEGNNDYLILNSFYEEFKNTNRIIILPDNLKATEYKGYIARMKFFIGARTHATIAAYSTNVPTMVLGYSVKSKGIAKDLFGEEKFVLGVNEISDYKKLIQCFEQMVEEEAAIKNHLQQKIPVIQKLSYKAVDYIKELT